ncbi:hypothetical protein W97_03560 [Coniosporium apollinis CBS 100218]|uniref:D-isomer specific 2-hydroxyacid dehydrogenase NAD-binding domain-containing protein n=1 Tax=Coniosporium apollinis (strain CBS 100218) TaxID=1168221 RepID=R7YR97_CONA1|nr:uncharacterized protein W97_03560 [Coniosporium apollinis CBS 100218]EON64329.1 hypothetical protein W97_03560 [Coniosporium apollinis CBS 100218]
MGGGPADKMLIVLPFPEPKAIIDRIRKQHPNIEITFVHLKFAEVAWKTYKEVPKEIYKDKTILVTLSALPPTPEDCPHLELIHFFSAGTNHIANHPIYTDTKITLTTSSGIHGPQIAEWVVMTALVQSHHYNKLYELQKQKRWGKNDIDGDYHRVRDLVGQRLGVLGYGSIGRQVGRVAKAMGMDVIAYTATPKDTPEKRRDKGFVVPGTGDPDGSIPSNWYSGLDKESLHHFLKQDIDVLLVSVPLTKETRHFLSTPEFEVLSKQHAFVTNISRGQIIDQPALVSALHDGSLRGAALDVTDPEPLPPDDPLWDAPNVTITPHISGVGQAYTDRAFQVLEVNLERREKGEKLINVVDRKRGY